MIAALVPWVRLASPQAGLAPAVLLAAVLVPLTWWGVRRSGRSELEAFLGAAAAVALVGALTVTLLRAGHSPAALDDLRRCRITDPEVLTTEGALNLLLLAPTAFLAVLAIGRPVAVSVAMACVSAGIEATQAITSVGVCDSSDVVHNALGAAVAALVAAAVRAGVRAVPRTA